MLSLSKIEDINSNNEFTREREKYLKNFLIILTLGGSGVVIFWTLFDFLFFANLVKQLFWLRISTILVYFINLYVAYRRNTHTGFRDHLIAGFYFGTIFCGLLAVLTGFFDSGYTYGFLFVLISWLVLIPFSFNRILAHSVTMLLLYNLIILFFSDFNFNWGQVLETNFIYIGVSVVGIAAAYFNNKFAVENYQIKRSNEIALEQLYMANSQLNNEIEKREAAVSELREKQLLLKVVLNQLPLIIWGVDFEGKFIFNEGSGLFKIGSRPGLHIGQNAFDIYKDNDQILNFIRKALKYEVESEIVLLNGIYWDTRVVPYVDQQGKPIGILGVSFDITELIKMQQSLLESEMKHRTLIEKSLDGVVITQAGKVLLVNQAFADMLGFTLEEMYMSFGPNTIAPEDRERVVGIHYKRMRGEIDNVRYTAALLSKSGERVIFDFNTTTILINNTPASLITARDVTEFTQIQNALKESESKYRMLIDRANDGIIITQFGKFRFANRAFCELMEYAEGEVLEKPFVDYLVAEDRVRLMEYHHKRMQGDKSQFIYECQAITKNGKVVHLELNTTYIDFQGHPATFIIMRDLTDRKAIERELEKSRMRYKNLIESIQEGLYVIQDQRFVFLNDSIVKLIGYKVEELLNHNFIEVIPPENRAKTIDRHLRRIKGEQVSPDLETTLLHKDGITRIPVILSSTLTEFDGRTAIVGTAKDISERIIAEQEIRAAHRKLEEINHTLETTIEMRTNQLTEANTQLIKLQKENLQSQFDMLKQQVNPHFLFNSLNVLSSLIKLEPDLAEKFTDHLSKVYRYVLENKDNEMVKLSTELEFLAAYTFLLDIRFMGKLEINIDIPDEKRSYLIIPLAMQLLIENAIKHNAMSKKSPLNINIHIDSKTNLVIKNNLQERENFFPSTGVGLKNIAHRYMLLNMKEPVFEKTDSEFIAKVPLLVQKNDESCNC
jgi:PAS domain S-box-containing protein